MILCSQRQDSCVTKGNSLTHFKEINSSCCLAIYSAIVTLIRTQSTDSHHPLLYRDPIDILVFHFFVHLHVLQLF